MNRRVPFHYVISAIIYLIVMYIVTKWILIKLLPDVSFIWFYLPVLILFSLLFIGTEIYKSRKSKITGDAFISQKNTHTWNTIEKVTLKKSEIGNPYLTLYFKDNSPPRGFDIEYMDKTNLVDSLQKIALQSGFALEIDEHMKPLLEEKPQKTGTFLESFQENSKKTMEEARHKEVEKKSTNVPEFTITPTQKKCILIILAVVFFLCLFIFFDIEIGIYLMIILFVHEGGHFVALKLFHLKMDMIIFIPLVGAGIVPKEGFKTPGTEAAVALAGPFAGLSLNVIGLILYEYFPFFIQHGNKAVLIMIFKFLLYCLPLNFLINLINLLPLSPLDGGRIVKSALLRGKKSLILLLVITVFMGIITTILLKSIFIAIILVIGVSTMIQHYQSLEKQEKNPPSWKMSLLILAAWICIIILYWVTLHPDSKKILTDFPFFDLG